jgi:hypothetical protein
LGSSAVPLGRELETPVQAVNDLPTFNRRAAVKNGVETNEGMYEFQEKKHNC